MANRFQNFYTTTLTTDIGANDDTIRVNTPPTDLVKGTLTIEARNPDKREIIKFTGVNDNLLTGVIRGAEGTRATTHNRNASVEMNVTAEMLNEAYESQSSLQDLVDKHFGDFIDEGAVVTVSARSISMTAGKVYIKGLIVDIPAVSSHTFTDNKDVAIDIDINGNLHYTESTIGSLAPLQPNRFRIWKAKVATTIQNIFRGRDVLFPNMRYTKSTSLSGSSTTIDLSDAPSGIKLFKVYISGSKTVGTQGSIGLSIGGKPMTQQTIVGIGTNITCAVAQTNLAINNADVGYDFHGEALILNTPWVSGSGSINGTARVLIQSFSARDGNAWSSLTLTTSVATFYSGFITVVGM